MNSEADQNQECPCTYPGCPRHGICEKCEEYHHSIGQQTSCEKEGKKRGK
jgi:hypothetical protein